MLLKNFDQICLQVLVITISPGFFFLVNATIDGKTLIKIFGFFPFKKLLGQNIYKSCGQTHYLSLFLSLRIITKTDLFFMPRINDVTKK